MQTFPVGILHKQATDRGLRFMVIGGHAVNAYLEPRVTLDVDFMICADDRDVWLELIQNEGFRIVNDGGNFLQFDPPHGIQWRLDLMIVGAKSFETLNAAANEVSCLGIPAKVPREQDLIAMKLHALHHGPPERRLKDLPDIVGLMNRLNWTVESAELAALLEKYGTPELRDAILTLHKKPE